MSAAGLNLLKARLRATRTGPCAISEAVSLAAWASIWPHDARLAVLRLLDPFQNAPGIATLAARSAAATTIQTWSSSVGPAVQDGGFYSFTLVGKDVTAFHQTGTTIKTKVIPIILSFDTGDVFDPTVANTGCGEIQSDVNGVLHGPIFKSHKYTPGGTNVGTVQYIDALQREEFWLFTQPHSTAPHYHVKLSAKLVGAQSIGTSGFPVIASGTCGALGLIEIGAWDSFVQNTLFPLLAAQGVSPTTFPIFLVKNVVFYNTTPSNCCILGYHSAFNNPSFGFNSQTYGIAEYDTSGEFGPAVQDNTVLTHEAGEWANDPYVNNATPAWGHIGQVPGCQGNLEVGDPLSGTTFPVVIGGKTYHAQELAFFGWFFGFNGGVNGWYSTNGTFLSPSSLCF